MTPLRTECVKCYTVNGERKRTMNEKYTEPMGEDTMPDMERARRNAEKWQKGAEGADIKKMDAEYKQTKSDFDAIADGK